MKWFFLVLGLFTILTQPVFAQVTITEIMYDVKGADDGREWVEIKNEGTSTIDFSKFKFFEGGVNHNLTSYSGTSTLDVGGFAVISDNPEKFLIDWPAFSGNLFNSSFTLSNSGESIALKNNNGVVVSTVAYTSTSGAAGDGDSLQINGSVWVAAQPSPGSGLVEVSKQVTVKPVEKIVQVVSEKPVISPVPQKIKKVPPKEVVEKYNTPVLVKEISTSSLMAQVFQSQPLPEKSEFFWGFGKWAMALVGIVLLSFLVYFSISLPRATDSPSTFGKAKEIYDANDFTIIE